MLTIALVSIHTFRFACWEGGGRREVLATT
jgi:hypothetical protein